jgi:hypothetical protein
MSFRSEVLSNTLILRIAVVSTAIAGWLISGGVQNAFYLFLIAVTLGSALVFYFSRFPLDTSKDAKPEDLKEFERLRPQGLACCSAAIVWINGLMFMGVAGLVSIPGVTVLSIVSGNVSAFLIATVIYSLQMPEWKRLPLTLAAYGLMLLVNIVAFTIGGAVAAPDLIKYFEIPLS